MSAVGIAASLPCSTIGSGDIGFNAQLGNKGFGDPLTFDNQYYKSLLQKPWEDPTNEMASMIGLPSDHVLPDDSKCRPSIEAYAGDQKHFFKDFGAAYVKLTLLGVQWS